MSQVNVVSISGGKDSTAMALLAIERETPNLRFVFADTGHEHQLTYDYVEYLSDELDAICGVGIDIVKADFSDRIANKRKVVQEKWRKDGIAEEKIQRALEVLHPTGNPFLDLCLWKGRFPSTRVRFCSEELKKRPVEKFHNMLWLDNETVIAWQGVRRDESRQRAELIEKDIELGTWEPEPKGLLTYRPILDWKAEDCFAQHNKFGVKWNPLYELGMGRVGCMPCIHVTKPEMFEIQRRFPEEIERVAEWEKIVSEASKTGSNVLLDVRVAARFLGTGTRIEDTSTETHGVKTYAEWSKTTRGGKQYDVIKTIESVDVPQCSSVYGLCE